MVTDNIALLIIAAGAVLAGGLAIVTSLLPHHNH